MQDWSIELDEKAKKKMTNIPSKIDEKKKFDMVIISNHPDGYFALNFEDRTIIEITFEEAFGSDFFDWHLGYALMSEYNKRMYDLARGKDGCGLHKYFFVRDDLHKARLREIREFDREIKQKAQLTGGKDK